MLELNKAQRELLNVDLKRLNNDMKDLAEILINLDKHNNVDLREVLTKIENRARLTKAVIPVPKE